MSGNTLEESTQQFFQMFSQDLELQAWVVDQCMKINQKHRDECFRQSGVSF